MGQKKKLKINNKGDKPDNILLKESEIARDCKIIESQLPDFLRTFFSYLKGSVLPMSRLSYLRDTLFFFKYIAEETSISETQNIKDISLMDIRKIRASDINAYIEYCRHYEKETESSVYIYENNNKTLARKKSSLSVMFKQLYREELLEKNIVEGFNPIKVPSQQEREVKALQDDEVMIMLDSVTTGEGLTDKEKVFWNKTKYRDKAILMVFLTYGLRLSELQQLNISSFNFNRGEFKIYRKRGKESIMPLNKSVTECLNEYLEKERNNLAKKINNSADKDALFLSLQSRRLTERQIRELVKKYTSIGMKTSRESGYSPHKLRATTATSLIGRGNSIFDVQALLDHEQVTTTQIYAAHQKNVKRDLIKNFEWEEERKED